MHDSLTDLRIFSFHMSSIGGMGLYMCMAAISWLMVAAFTIIFYLGCAIEY
jgi:hypothetical protein